MCDRAHIMMKAIHRTILLQRSKQWKQTILGAKEYYFSYQILLEGLKIYSLEHLQHFLGYYGLMRHVLPLNSMKKNPQPSAVKIQPFQGCH